MNEIGININAKATGDADLQKQINQLRQVSDATQNLTAFQMDYSEVTEKTGGNIKENMRLLSELEQQQRREITSHRKDTQFEYEQRMGDADTTAKKEAVKQWKIRQKRVLRQMETETDEYADELRGYRTQYGGSGGDQAGGDGLYRGGAGMGLMQGLATGGLGRGMVMGGMRQGASMMQGMGGAGKLAMGGLVGGAAYLGFKALQWGAEGIEANKQFYKSMLPFRAALKDMGGDTDHLNNRIKQLSLNIGESTQKTIQLSKEWKKMGGGDEFGTTDQQAMGDTLRRAMIWGIDKQAAISYVGQMARYGTYQDAGSLMNQGMINEALKGAQNAGMGGFRREEYMQQVLGVVQNIAGTAGIVNDPATQAWISQVAGLGEPFRGQRGASFMGRIHGGLTRADQSGIKYLATRGMDGMGGASIFKLRSQQLKGMADPDNLGALWSQIKGMYGGDMEMASMAFAKELGMEDQLRMIYNTDEIDGVNLKDSLIEQLDLGFKGTLKEGLGKSQFDPEVMKKRFIETKKDLKKKGLLKGGIYFDSDKIAIAKAMSERYEYGEEDLFTTRTPELQGMSPIDIWWKTNRNVNESEIFDYQSALQESKYTSDKGWKSALIDIKFEIAKLNATEGMYGLVQAIKDKVTGIVHVSPEDAKQIIKEERGKYVGVYDLFSPY